LYRSYFIIKHCLEWESNIRKAKGRAHTSRLQSHKRRKSRKACRKLRRCPTRRPTPIPIPRSNLDNRFARSIVRVVIIKAEREGAKENALRKSIGRELHGRLLVIFKRGGYKYYTMMYVLLICIQRENARESATERFISRR